MNKENIFLKFWLSECLQMTRLALTANTSVVQPITIMVTLIGHIESQISQSHIGNHIFKLKCYVSPVFVAYGFLNFED